MAKKTTEFVLLFHKNITKLVFLWPNMCQISVKVLNNYFYFILTYFSDEFYMEGCVTAFQLPTTPEQSTELQNQFPTINFSDLDFNFCKPI